MSSLGASDITARKQTAQVLQVPEAVADSFSYCEHVTQARARNFYYGLKLTPEPKRSAIYAIYAFMRACDDLVDDALDEAPPVRSQLPASTATQHEASVSEALARIETFRATMEQVIAASPGDPLPQGQMWPAFAHVMRTYPIDPKHLHDMLDGQRCDLKQDRYETFEELYDYCYKVASVVGLVCIAIWGSDGDPAVRQLAEYRGIAFQLTNIIRDVAEDAQRGRIYLPLEDFDRFGYSPEQLIAGKPSPGFDRLITYEIERAASYYEMSATLDKHLAPCCRATNWAMTRIYRGLLRRIGRRPRKILTQRVRLSNFEKATIAMRANLRQWRSR